MRKYTIEDAKRLITDLCVRTLNCLAFDWLVEPQMSYYDTVYGYDDWHMSMSNW